MKTYPAFACLLILAFSVFVGCGGEKEEDLGPKYGQPVTGKVLGGGSPITFPGADDTVSPDVLLINAENEIVARTPYNSTDGTFEFSGVKPGKYKLNMSDPMNSDIDSRGVFVAVPVEIAESTTDLGTHELKK